MRDSTNFHSRIHFIEAIQWLMAYVKLVHNDRGQNSFAFFKKNFC